MRNFLWISLMMLISVAAHAQVDVRFTNKELDAAFVLMRPELNSIEIDGRTGVFNPAPSLKALGVEPQSFAIDMGWIANVADLSFNHLKASTPQVKFQSGAFQISVPVGNQDRAIQSRLGSISFKNVVLTANLGWKVRTDGRQDLVLISTSFNGQMTGSGVLRSSMVLNKTKELMMKLLTNTIDKVIKKPTIQESLQNGLLGWAKFYTGDEHHEIRAGSLQFFNDSQTSGISYLVQ